MFGVGCFKEMHEIFLECFENRFDENSCEITSAFAIFDTKDFPDFSKIPKVEYDERVAAYGNDDMKVLVDWYGCEKNVHVKTFPPVVDSV